MGCLIQLILLPFQPFLAAWSWSRTFLLFTFNILGIEVVDTSPPPPLDYVKHTFDKQGRNKDGVLLEIEARQQGFIGWMMSRSGMHNTSIIRVTKEEVRVSNVAPFSTTHFVAPLSSITTSYYKVKKTPWLAYIGFGLIFFGLFNLLLSFDNSYAAEGNLRAAIFLIITSGAPFLAYYFFNEVVIGFSTDNIDAVATLSLQNITLFGGGIPYEELMEIFEYIDVNINRSHGLQ